MINLHITHNILWPFDFKVMAKENQKEGEITNSPCLKETCLYLYVTYVDKTMVGDLPAGLEPQHVQGPGLLR